MKLLMVSAAVLVLAAPARASDTGASLTLMVHQGANTAAPATSVTLTCDPDGGSDPNAAKACAALRAVNGDFTRLPDRHRLCMMIYRPVTAHAYGTWHGRPVSYQKTFGNDCQLHTATDPVFQYGGRDV